MKKDEIGFKIMRLEKVVKQIQEKSEKRKLLIENTLIVLFLIGVAVIASKITMTFWK